MTSFKLTADENSCVHGRKSNYLQICNYLKFFFVSCRSLANCQLDFNLRILNLRYISYYFGSASKRIVGRDLCEGKCMVRDQIVFLIVIVFVNRQLSSVIELIVQFERGVKGVKKEGLITVLKDLFTSPRRSSTMGLPIASGLPTKAVLAPESRQPLLGVF